MPTIAVLPSQKNEILHAIQTEGLDPSNFGWHKRFRHGNRQETEEVLKYKNSNYWFAFTQPLVGNKHGAEFSPGRERIEEYATAINWVAQMGNVRSWLRTLKRELEAPDLWGALREGSTLLQDSNVGSTAENTPISAPERERLASALRELKEYAEATYRLSSDQTAHLEARVEYLIAWSRYERDDPMCP